MTFLSIDTVLQLELARQHFMRTMIEVADGWGEWAGVRGSTSHEKQGMDAKLL